MTDCSCGLFSAPRLMSHTQIVHSLKHSLQDIDPPTLLTWQAALSEVDQWRTSQISLENVRALMAQLTNNIENLIRCLSNILLPETKQCVINTEDQDQEANQNSSYTPYRGAIALWFVSRYMILENESTLWTQSVFFGSVCMMSKMLYARIALTKLNLEECALFLSLCVPPADITNFNNWLTWIKEQLEDDFLRNVLFEQVHQLDISQAKFQQLQKAWQDINAVINIQLYKELVFCFFNIPSCKLLH
uniref:Uncharacterized protein n=1 Tax=Ranid herpesvirus 4 TaxID=2849006 RepID=A0A8F3CIG1_9VIRU|nr:MAG: hypothetical protein [Ranid herpesvirus 4]